MREIVPLPGKPKRRQTADQRRPYRKAYYLRNRERIRREQAERYRQNRAVLLARVKAWREANKDEISKRRKRFYQMHRADAIAYSVRYYAEMLKKGAEWRVRKRQQLRAYSRGRSANMTDSYVREQLSKYSTKSAWEWTPEEVANKFHQMRANRAKKLTDAQVAEIQRRHRAGETAHDARRLSMQREHDLQHHRREIPGCGFASGLTQNHCRSHGSRYGTPQSSNTCASLVAATDRPFSSVMPSP